MHVDYYYDEALDSWIVSIIGEVDIYNAPQLKEQLLSLLEERKANVILQCQDLKYIDSTGLGVLISALKRVKDYDGTITIRGLKPYILKIFTLTGLDRVFTIEVEA
ncbi:MAG: STAS domain-containing protein [Clostridia bacterium]|jgi:anti-sigma B factor antagonist